MKKPGDEAQLSKPVFFKALLLAVVSQIAAEGGLCIIWDIYMDNMMQEY